MYKNKFYVPDILVIKAVLNDANIPYFKYNETRKTLVDLFGMSDDEIESRLHEIYNKDGTKSYPSLDVMIAYMVVGMGITSYSVIYKFLSNEVGHKSTDILECYQKFSKETKLTSLTGKLSEYPGDYYTKVGRCISLELYDKILENEPEYFNVFNDVYADELPNIKNIQKIMLGVSRSIMENFYDKSK